MVHIELETNATCLACGAEVTLDALLGLHVRSSRAAAGDSTAIEVLTNSACRKCGGRRWLARAGFELRDAEERAR